MNQFARDLGILQGDPAYEKVVAARFAELWSPQVGQSGSLAMRIE